MSRSNYTPDAAEKHLVHYKVEKRKFDPNTGERLSHPEIVKTSVKLFPSIKRNLELQGYGVEILFHPQGQYNTPITDPVEAEEAPKERIEGAAALEVKTAEVEAKNAEIEELRRQLAEKEALLAEKAKEAAIDLNLDGTEEAPAGEVPEEAKKVGRKKKQ